MAGDIQMQVTEFIGLSFSRQSMPQVLDALARRPPESSFAYLVTPNVDHMVRLTEQGEAKGGWLWRAYREADVVLCDSRILRRLAKLKGVTLPLVTRSDLTRRLFDEVVDSNDRIILIGGKGSTLACWPPNIHS